MFGERDAGPASNDLQMVEELELNSREEIEGARHRDSLQLKIATTLNAGNASDRGVPTIHGKSKEVSRLAMTGRFDRPVRVGDVYSLGFDRGELDVPPTFALCQRCSMVSDDCFEATLSFFAEIDLA